MFPLKLLASQRAFGKELMKSRVRAYEGQTELLEALFALGCAWATDPRPFAEALKITADMSRMASGNTRLLYLRRYPALRYLYAGGIAAVYRQRWDTLRALTLDATAPAADSPGLGGPTLPMAAALDYWSIFQDLRTAQFLPDQARNHFPISNYLLGSLREPLHRIIPVDDEYEAAFDRFEYMIGLIIEDARSQQPQDIWSHGPVGNFNRNRYSTTCTPPLWDRIKTEAEQAGADWGPIQAGIFGGSIERFTTAEKRYRSHVLKTLHTRTRR